jgi:hypothetical protein
VQEVSDDDSDASAAQKVMHGLDCGPLRPVVVDSGEGVVGENKAQAGRQPSTAQEVERPAQESDLQSQSPVGRRGRRRQGQPSVQKALPPRLVGNAAGSAEHVDNKDPEQGNKEPERAAKLGDQPVPDPLAALDGRACYRRTGDDATR